MAAPPQDGRFEAKTTVAKLATGPFAVRAIQTPRVANTAIGRAALRQRNIPQGQQNAKGGVISPSLFQTKDGRVFALSNGRNIDNFGPGQIFQTADGRFFTLAVAAGQKGFVTLAKKQKESLFEEQQKASHQQQQTRLLPDPVPAVPRQPDSQLALSQISSGPLEEQQAVTAEEIAAARLQAIHAIEAARDKAIQRSRSKIVSPRNQIQRPAVKETNEVVVVQAPARVPEVDLFRQETLHQQQIRFQLQQQELEIQRLQRLQQQLQIEHQKRQEELIKSQQQSQLHLQRQQQRQLQRQVIAKAPLTQANSRFIAKGQPFKSDVVTKAKGQPTLDRDQVSRSKSRFRGDRTKTAPGQAWQQQPATWNQSP